MKALLFTAILLFYCTDRRLSAQNVRIAGDTCASNYTTYTKLNDSTYAVSYIKGDVIFYEGQVIYPKTFVHLGDMMSDGKVDTDRLGWKQDGICIKRNALGSTIEWAQYQNGKINELKRFDHDTLFFHIYKKSGIEYRKTYARGKTTSLEKFYPDKHLLISKTGKSVTKFATGKDRNQLLYIYGNKSISTERLYPGKTITYYHDKTFIVKKNETYRNGKLTYVEEYDIRQRPLSKSYFDAKGKMYEKKTFYYEEDSNSNKSGSVFISNIYPHQNENEIYTIYKKQSIVEYRSNNQFYKISFTGDTINLNFTDKDPLSQTNSLSVKIISNPNLQTGFEEISIKTKAISVQKIDDYEIRSLITGFELNQYFHNILYDPGTYYLILNLSGNFSYDREELRDIRQIFNLSYRSPHRTDSIFKNGHLKYIAYNNKDTSILYEIEEGKPKLSYYSHLFYIAKDQELCNLGLKTNEGKWLNERRYEQMDKLDLGFRHQYYVGYSSGYLSVYNWQGQLLFGPMYGVRYGNFDPEYSTYKYYLTYRADNDTSEDLSLRFHIDNKRDSIFGFADINGKMIHHSKYRIIDIDFNNSNYTDYGWEIEDGNKRGYADLNGIIIPPVFQSVYKTPGNYFIVSDSLGYFLLDSLGKSVFNEKFRNIEINRDSNTVVFIGPKILIYKLNQVLKVFEGSNIELEYFNSHFYKIKDKSSGKMGLVSRGFNFKTQTIYDEILVYPNAIICKNGKYHVFYDYNLKTLNTVIADTIYFKTQDFAGWRHQNQIFNHDAGNDFPIRRIRFGLEKKIGLLDMTGEIIIPAQYEIIGLDDHHNCYGIIGDRLDCYGSGNKLLSKNEAFPRESFTQIFEWSRHSLLKVLDWMGNEINSPVGQIKYLNPNLYSLSYGGNVIGFMNYKGQLMFNIDSVQTIEYFFGYYYYQNKRKQAGIMNCRFVPHFNPEFQYISDVYQNRYVWLSNSGYVNYPYEYIPTGQWRLMDIKTKRLHPDTFYNPCPLNTNYTIVKNKAGLLGILDSNLNYYRKCIYTRYLDLYIEDVLIFIKSDSSMDVFNQNFKYRKTIRYEMIKQYEEYEDGFLAFKNGITYILDKDFNAVDSSKCIFADRESSFSYVDSSEFDNFCSLYLDRIPENKFKQIQTEKWKKGFPAAAYNFYRVIASLQYDHFRNQLNSGRIHFFTLNTDRYTYPHHFDFDILRLDRVFLNDSSLSGIVNYHEFESGHSSYQIEGYKGKLCSFSKRNLNMSDDIEFVNFCFTDKGAYEINLIELIDPLKTESFEKLLLKKVIMLDDPEAPCLKKDDLLNTYSNSFIFGIDSLMIYINNEYSLTISYEEMKDFLNKDYLKYW